MYRIVHNEQTRQYRVEKRGWLGWNFFTDPATGNYLGFGDFDAAHDWLCAQQRDAAPTSRRWRVVQDCAA